MMFFDYAKGKPVGVPEKVKSIFKAKGGRQ